MELIERDDFLNLLRTGFSKTEMGEGHCFFITGEAGIGKTALVKTFLQQLGDKAVQYSGACDSLFTAWQLAPLYDLAMQINEDWVDHIHSLSSRTALFTKFVQELSNKKKPVMLVFEDIHWADEATFDFIKFFARECYLTSHVKDAIIYQGKALKIRKELNEIEKIGNCLRFLSRLWWFEGNRKYAEDFAKQAIDLLESQAASSEKAMAFSNMSQLKRLSDEMEDCIYWGEKAIEIAREIQDEEAIAHALINMGSSLMTNRPTMMEGISFLNQGLAIGLRNSWHEHVGRAYTALGSNAVTMKDYVFAKTNLDEGISYCEERDLYSLKLYMLCWKARLSLETGNWDEALEISNNLLKKEDLLPVIKIGALVVAATIKIRRGEDDALPLLNEAKMIAFKTMELQRIVPALSALLEYEWITGKCFIEKEVLNSTIQTVEKLKKMANGNRFYFWLNKARRGYPVGKINDTEDRNRCPYKKALILFDGKEADKRNAIAIIQRLGASPVYEKLKMEMRVSGIKKIPRGLRLSTKTNPAQLTNRELDVLLLLQKGVQNKEIAETLFISPKTVDHHVSGILFKLDAGTRLKAVGEAVRLGILK